VGEKGLNGRIEADELDKSRVEGRTPASPVLEVETPVLDERGDLEVSTRAVSRRTASGVSQPTFSTQPHTFAP
jgi:hypothetical protein